MDFDIFGDETPAKGKKDLKNQDMDMVVGPGADIVVEDQFDSEGEESHEKSSNGTKRSEFKTSSGNLHMPQSSSNFSDFRSSDINLVDHSMSALKNSNQDNSLMESRPESKDSSQRGLKI